MVAKASPGAEVPDWMRTSGANVSGPAASAGLDGYVRPPARFASLDYDHVPHHPSPPVFLNLACLSIAFNVPAGTPRLGLPATVTMPCLSGFLY